VKLLSSKMTFFYKRVFPVLWFGIILVALGVLVAGGLHDKHGKPVPAAAFLPPAVLLVIGGLVMKYLLFDLADEVFDGVEFLVVRKGGVEEKILFGNVRNVSFQSLINPPRVTLSLREDTRLGREIAFIPPWRFAEAFRGRNPVVESLIDRMDRARR